MKISDQHNIPLQKPSITLSSTLSDNSQGESKLDLRSGELLKALVTGFAEDGKVMLDIGGRLISAKSMTPLTLHSELWLEVAKGGEHPLLNLAGKKGAVQDFLRSFLVNSALDSQSSKIGQSLSSLLSDLPAAMTATDKAAISTMISAHIDHKPAPEMLKIAAALLGGKTGLKEGLFSVNEKISAKNLVQASNFLQAEKITKIITAHQEVNSQQPMPNNENFWLFPCFFAGQSGWGEWLFSMEKDGGDEKRKYTLAFFLELSNLGPLTLRATIADKAFTGEFSLQTEKSRAFLAKHLPELKNILVKQHFSPVSLTSKVNDDNLLQQLKQTLEKKAAIKQFSLIDVSV